MFTSSPNTKLRSSFGKKPNIGFAVISSILSNSTAPCISKLLLTLIDVIRPAFSSVIVNTDTAVLFANTFTGSNSYQTFPVLLYLSTSSRLNLGDKVTSSLCTLVHVI